MSLMDEMRKSAKQGSGQFWKPKKKGAELFGVVTALALDQQSKKYKNVIQNIYTIKTDKETVRFSASHDGIKPLLADAKIGSQIYIRYEGDVKLGPKQIVKQYAIAVNNKK